MTKTRFLAIACAAVSAAAIAGPFDSLKGKLKDGMYEYKTEVDMSAMPGVPPGMAKQSSTTQHCVRPQDIEKGQMGRGPDRDGKAPACEIKNFSQSGNNATYTMVCKEMTADNKITFTGEGFNMDMKMAINEGGTAFNMTRHVEGRYLGPCK